MSNLISMRPRETEREVVIKDERYRVLKMNVWDGSYLLKFLIEKCLPIIESALTLFEEIEQQEKVKGKNKRSTASEEDAMARATMLIPALLQRISDEDLKTIITKCLNHAEKLMDAGWQRVMTKNSFGIADVEYDMEVCLSLCWNVIKLNCGGFFSGGGFHLQDIMSGLTKSPKL